MEQPSAARDGSEQEEARRLRLRMLLAAWEREARRTERTASPEPPHARERSRRFAELLLRQLEHENAPRLQQQSSDHGYEVLAMVQELSALRRASARMLEGAFESPLRSSLDAQIDAELQARLATYLESRNEALARLQDLRRGRPGREEGRDFTSLLTLLLDSCESVSSVDLFLPRGGGLQLVSCAGYPAADRPEEANQESAVERAFLEGVEVERVVSSLDSVEPAPLGTMGLLCIPVMHGARALGALQLGSRSRRRFSREDKFFGGIVADALAEKLSFQSYRRGQEDAKRQIEQALARLDSMLAAAPTGMAFFDTQLVCARVNEGFAALSGRAVESLLGRGAAEVVPASGDESVESMMREVLRTRQSLTRVPLGAKQGTPPGAAPFLATFFPVMTRDRELLGLGVVVTDESAHVAEEESLRRVAQARETFVGVVSHDLRNPLQNLLIGLERLSLIGLPPASAELLRRIQRNARRMEYIIRDLQELTRIQRAGGLTVRPERMDLRALAESTLEEMRSLTPHTQLSLQAQGDTRGEWDAERLTQLLVNLLSNAADYATESTPIVVEVEGSGEHVWLRVKNQGEPIPEERLATLFDPFQRERRTGQRSHGVGLGLGLYIVKQIALAHGGDVSVTRAEGVVCFSVQLPRSSSPR